MTNIVNLKLIVKIETKGDSTEDGWRVFAESPEDYVFLYYIIIITHRDI